MNLRFHFTLAALLGLLASPALRADGFGPASDVAIYLSPDTAAPVFLRFRPDNTLLAGGQAVLDPAKAGQGWESLVLPGPFTGFVPTNKSRKDLSVTPGTPVHTAADDASPVLGNAPDNPALILTNAEVTWSQVNFPGPVTVYFVKPATMPAPVAPAAVAPAVVAAPTPPPVAAPIAPVAPPVKVTPIAPVVAATPPLTVTAIPAPKQADPGDLPRFFYGTLKLRTDTKIPGPVNAQYALYDNKGALIGLVDLNDVVLGGPIVAYLDHPVKIYGTTYNSPRAIHPILHALTLQTMAN